MSKSMQQYVSNNGFIQNVDYPVFIAYFYTPEMTFKSDSKALLCFMWHCPILSFEF